MDISLHRAMGIDIHKTAPFHICDRTAVCRRALRTGACSCRDAGISMYTALRKARRDRSISSDSLEFDGHRQRCIAHRKVRTPHDLSRQSQNADSAISNRGGISLCSCVHRAVSCCTRIDTLRDPATAQLHLSVSSLESFALSGRCSRHIFSDRRVRNRLLVCCTARCNDLDFDERPILDST